MVAVESYKCAAAATTSLVGVTDGAGGLRAMGSYMVWFTMIIADDPAIWCAG